MVREWNRASISNAALALIHFRSPPTIEELLAFLVAPSFSNPQRKLPNKTSHHSLFGVAVVLKLYKSVATVHAWRGGQTVA